MQNGVTFWTEGGPSIGMGHLMRCINIARALDDMELPTHFLVNDERTVAERLDAEGFYHLNYPLTGLYSNNLTSEVVVIDTKKDVGAQVKSLKQDGRKVVLIDNTTANEADAIIMPTAICADKGGKNLLSGVEYLIIGKNFKKERKEGHTHTVPLNVLVTMGGADPFNLTEKVVSALTRVEGIEVTVVMGPAAKVSEGMEVFMRGSDKRFRFLFNLKDMASVMDAAHIAFTAVGTTVWELAYMGVPSILIGNYPEDRFDLQALEALGISKSLGYYGEVTEVEIRRAVEWFKTGKAGWKEMSDKAKNLTDGDGASRIAGVIASFAQEFSGRNNHKKTYEVGDAQRQHHR